MGNVLIVDSSTGSCTKVSEIITHMQHNAVDVHTLESRIPKARSRAEERSLKTLMKATHRNIKQACSYRVSPDHGWGGTTKAWHRICLCCSPEQPKPQDKE